MCLGNKIEQTKKASGRGKLKEKPLNSGKSIASSINRISDQVMGSLITFEKLIGIF